MSRQQLIAGPWGSGPVTWTECRSRTRIVWQLIQYKGSQLDLHMTKMAVVAACRRCWRLFPSLSLSCRFAQPVSFFRFFLVLLAGVRHKIV